MVIAAAKRTNGQGGCPLGSRGQLAERDPEARALIAAGFDQWAAAVSANGLRSLHADGKLPSTSIPTTLPLLCSPHSKEGSYSPRCTEYPPVRNCDRYPPRSYHRQDEPSRIHSQSSPRSAPRVRIALVRGLRFGAAICTARSVVPQCPSMVIRFCDIRCLAEIPPILDRTRFRRTVRKVLLIRESRVRVPPPSPSIPAESSQKSASLSQFGLLNR